MKKLLLLTLFSSALAMASTDSAITALEQFMRGTKEYAQECTKLEKAYLANKYDMRQRHIEENLDLYAKYLGNLKKQNSVLSEDLVWERVQDKVALFKKQLEESKQLSTAFYKASQDLYEKFNGKLSKFENHIVNTNPSKKWSIFKKDTELESTKGDWWKKLSESFNDLFKRD